MAHSIDPSLLQCDLVTRAGAQFHVRPLTPVDACLIERFVNALSPEDRRLRFLVPVRQMDKKLATQLAQTDPTQGVAILATDIHTHEPSAIARFHLDKTGTAAEFAVAVRSDFHGRGLGYALMQHLLKLAKLYGLRELWGTVLNDNQPMLALAKALGMSSTMSGKDNTVRVFAKLPTANDGKTCRS